MLAGKVVLDLTLQSVPFPKEINENFIQNTKLLIYGEFSKHGLILLSLHRFIGGLL
jgi:hypothetical protein